MVVAHSAGYTNLQTIRPMLDGPDEFSIGVLTVGLLAPASLHLRVKKRTRSEVLACCRALETKVSAVLRSDAEDMMEHNKDTVTYNLEWSEQATIADLKDVPDDRMDSL